MKNNSFGRTLHFYILGKYTRSYKDQSSNHSCTQNSKVPHIIFVSSLTIKEIKLLHAPKQRWELNIFYRWPYISEEKNGLYYKDTETICFLYIYFKIFKIRFLIQTTYTNKLNLLKWGEKNVKENLCGLSEGKYLLDKKQKLW